MTRTPFDVINEAFEDGVLGMKLLGQLEYLLLEEKAILGKIRSIKYTYTIHMYKSKYYNIYTHIDIYI